MKCPNCHRAALKAGKAAHRVTVAGHKYVVTVPADVCPSCGEVYLHGEAAIRADLAVARHITSHGPVTGEGFAFARQALGLQARELAPLLGRRPEALSKWERGHGEIDRAAWGVLGSLVADRLRGADETLERLRVVARARKVPAIVRMTGTPDAHAP